MDQVQYHLKLTQAVKNNRKEYQENDQDKIGKGISIEKGGKSLERFEEKD